MTVVSVILKTVISLSHYACVKTCENCLFAERILLVFNVHLHVVCMHCHTHFCVMLKTNFKKCILLCNLDKLFERKIYISRNFLLCSLQKRVNTSHCLISFHQKEDARITKCVFKCRANTQITLYILHLFTDIVRISHDATGPGTSNDGSCPPGGKHDYDDDGTDFVTTNIRFNTYETEMVFTDGVTYNPDKCEEDNETVEYRIVPSTNLKGLVAGDPDEVTHSNITFTLLNDDGKCFLFSLLNITTHKSILSH